MSPSSQLPGAEDPPARIDQLRFVYDLVEPLRVAPGRKVQLHRDFRPEAIHGPTSKREALTRLSEGVTLLVDYQDRLAAQDAVGVLLIIQGLDAAGKDSTIKHVMNGVNPQGVEVRSFKQPSVEELNHDFLWRYQRSLPGRGRIGIFNRSQYEEVLVVRVHHQLLAEERLPEEQKSGVWNRRYREINEWERHLVDNGIRVVKVLLNLSKDEQARRILKRIDDPAKNWKFSPSDILERQYWDQYQKAFDTMLSRTSTEWAPWYVVPADHKWFSRLATAAVLIRALAEIDPHYPRPAPEIIREMDKAKAALLTEIGR
jgi:PPK2 family polyphosphate:nucleotide phosphotransferase